MASNERIRKYLDAGTVLGQVSRGRAEEIVRELVNAGDIQRSQAQEWVDNLVERSRKTSEQVLELVRHEVATQLGKIDGKSLETIANQVADILKKSADAGRSATKDVTKQAGKTAKASQRGRQDSEGRHDAGRQDRQGRAQRGRQDRHAGAGGRHQGGADPTSQAQDRRAEGTREEFGRAQGADQEGPGQEARFDRQVGQEGRQLTTGSRRRLDTELVRRGLFPSRHEAQAAIAAGTVLVAGAPADKPARLVAPDEAGGRARAAVALRRPRRAEARCGAVPVRGPGQRPPCPRCRSVHRWLHRLPAPAWSEPRLRRRRRPRSAPSRRAGGPARHGPRAHQRPDADRGRPVRGGSRLRAVPAGRRPTSRSSRSAASCPPSSVPCRPRTPTWSCWSSPSSRRARRRVARQGRGARPGGLAGCPRRAWCPRSMRPEPASWGRWPLP